MPQALAVTARDRGVFAHAHHCLAATMAPYEAERLPSPGSPGRCVRMQALLEESAGKITVEDIKHMPADHAAPQSRTAPQGEVRDVPDRVVSGGFPGVLPMHLSRWRAGCFPFTGLLAAPSF